MNGRILRILYGILVIVFSAILMPLVFTQLSTITSANITNFTGLSSVVPISGLVFMLEVFLSGGYMSVSGARGQTSNMSEIKNSVWGIIILYVGLILFPLVISSFNTLYPAAAALSPTLHLENIVGIFPLLIYVGMFLGGGWMMAKGAGFRRGKGGHKKVRSFA